MTNIIFVRHGETVWNQERRYQGQQDSPLSANGILQAQKVGIYLSQRSIAAVYSSDLQRALITAQNIAKRHRLDPAADPRLREMCFGIWEGLTREEIIKRYPDQFYARYVDSFTTRVPGGELPSEVVERFQNFLDETLPKHVGETIVVVSHGGALRSMIATLLHIPLEKAYCIRQSNAGISEFFYTKKNSQCSYEAESINCTTHLR